jgi:hypothetical protein
MGRAVLGLVLCLVGAVWFGQGLNWIKGSFMTGHGFWTVMGALVFVVGGWLIATGLSRRPKQPDH